MRWLIGIFMILHGLVHAWYVVLSFGLVPYQPDMGWTGESWLLKRMSKITKTRNLSGFLYALAGLGFMIGGILLLTNSIAALTFLLGSAIFSGLIIVLFWDGQLNMLIQKGLIGFLIDIGIIIYITLFQ